MAHVVELDRIGVSLGGRPVLSELSLTVDAGSAVGVAGPNGSGKTTLVRTVATLHRINHGSGLVLGADLGTDEIHSIRSRIGLIGHNPTLFDELTLEENLIHVARLSGIDESRVANALDVVGLGSAADRRANASSFGMRRRVEIAHLLLTRPDLLLLDEAASGLDESASSLINALIDGVKGRGGAAIVVSHDGDQLDRLCDDVLRISSGALVR